MSEVLFFEGVRDPLVERAPNAKISDADSRGDWGTSTGPSRVVDSASKISLPRIRKSAKSTARSVPDIPRGILRTPHMV